MLTVSAAGTLLWECAWEAVVLAFFVRLFGGIAVEIVGDIWHDMAPSPSPGFERGRLLEQDSASALSLGFVREHSFVLLVVTFFLLKSATRLAIYSRVRRHRQAAAWAGRLFQRASEEWFHLIVGNAFGALVAAIILQVTSQFSFAQLVWQFCLDLLRPLVQAIAHLLPLSGGLDRFGAWFDWYGHNQLQFAFWFFYTTAICDDLGLPIFKTLARYDWRRFFRRASHAAPSTESPTAESPD